jgi:hypothetical protein
MPHRERALARTGAPADAAPSEEVTAAEARLRAIVEDVTALDLELEALSSALAAFAHAWDRALGEPFARHAAAERLVRRLQALEEGLLELAERLVRAATSGETSASRGARAPSRERARADEREVQGGARASGEEGAAGDEGADAREAEPEAVALKRLYRRLARLLHPDLAEGDGEEARRSDLMAKVNAAYARGDLAALQVMTERVGAGDLPGELCEAERLAHLARRIETLARIAAALARERDRLLRSDTERLRAEAERRARAGEDLVAETRAELAEETAAADADALARLDRAADAARAVSTARESAMRRIERRGPTGARRAFDPLAESDLVRQGASRLARRAATPAGRELARALEDAARSAPWEVALTALAFFAEEGGARPPEAIATADGLSARWDRLRSAWPSAPALAALLARPPRHLAVGAREGGGRIHAGLQLATADLAAGVRIALERVPVAAIAAEVLAALGPDEDCPGCGARGPARHLERTRGLDARHGLACAACGAVLRSYWRYGELDGLEALAPYALRLGLVAEVSVELAGTVLGFQLLPSDAAALTAGRLRGHFAELYLDPYQVTLSPEAVLVEGQEGALARAARLAGHGPLRLAVAPRAGTTAEELLELLRARIERRFRP